MRNKIGLTRSAVRTDATLDLSHEHIGYFDRAILAATDRVMRRHGIGRLRLVLPSGAAAVVGDTSRPIGAEIAVRSFRALWMIARRGALGFAEAYMDGSIDTPDLRAVFDFYLANEPAIVQAHPRLNDTRGIDYRQHRDRSNTIAGSRRNIADHYDLGNAFYSLWLDPSMLYSSGIFRDDGASLEDAQREKVSVILEALELQHGQALLEIGCGWGAMAVAAAEGGARVRAITISEQQLHAARLRLEQKGLSGRADIVFEDYRATTGTFDRIVSIEMIEAVGEEHWPTYFSTISDRLAPGGSAVIQAITIHEDAFERYRDNPDFIQRYIFPGGMLPTVQILRQRSDAAGLSFETIERFGPSYAATLAEWRTRFLAAWPQIAALGFNERFRRMWLYYLDYCEIGFERGLIDVGIYRLRKPLSVSVDATDKEANS